MDDQIIDAAMARSLHADASRAHPLVGWIVMRDPPDYPDRFVARLVTAAASPYILVADTLAEVQAACPMVSSDPHGSRPICRMWSKYGSRSSLRRRYAFCSWMIPA